MKKYNFIEFLCALESDDFDNPDYSWKEFYIKFLKQYPDLLINDGIHHGDCTKVSCPCDLCVLETLLKEFYQYTFDEKTFRKENM
jgi:hypothetical protein